MEQLCIHCPNPGKTDECEHCGSSAVRCATCAVVHRSTHTFYRTANRGGVIVLEPTLTCTECEQEGVWVCIEPLQYLCEDHSKNKGYELYPISQVRVLEDYPEDGVEILRRGKKIEEAAKLLRTQIDGLEACLQLNAEEEYQKVVSALNQAKAKLMTDIEKCVGEIKADLEVSLTRLLEQRFNQCVTPESKLEEVILNSTFSVLKDEKWAICRTEPLILSAIPVHLFLLERKEELLEPVSEECPWKDQYYCVPGNPVRLVDLTNYQLGDTSLNLPYVRGLVWTALADGRTFFCGNEDNLGCMIIDKEYCNCIEAGKLNIRRSSPGLVSYARFVYIFGGLQNKKCLNSIEKFSLKTNTSILLFGKMNSSRAQFTPCVWKDQLILSAGIGCGSTEIFDPVTETCHTSISFQYAISSICLDCGEEEIVILSGNIHLYFPNSEIYETLTQDVIMFLNPGEVILHGDEYYFLTLLDQTMHICSLNKVTHEFTPVLAIPSLSS